MTDALGPVRLSVVVPFYNEQGNVAPLIEEILAAFGNGPALEIVAVNDGSTDATGAELIRVAAECDALRVIVHRRNYGQSAALVTGVRAARGALIATLDGDGQNPPAELPRLFEAYRAAAVDGPVLIVGRRHRRRDSRWRQFCSQVANRVRQWALRDGCDDTGCGLKVFSRALFVDCPQFDHMHRFLPALAARGGATIINVNVADRKRRHGVSKYGVRNRLWVGLIDVLGVAWLARRRLATKADIHELG